MSSLTRDSIVYNDTPVDKAFCKRADANFGRHIVYKKANPY